MPPEENKNINPLKPDPIKIGIDPVFKSTTFVPKKPIDQANPVSAYGALNNQQYTPTQTPLQAAVMPTVNTNAQKSIVRTFKADMESAIKADHLSSINIAIAENQKMNKQIREEQAKVESIPSGEYSKNKIIIFISILLIVLGIGAISIIYFINKPTNTPVVQVQELPALITTEYKDELNTNTIGKDKFISTLATRLHTAQIQAGMLYNTYITTGTSTSRRLITSTEFLTAMAFETPDIIKRSLLSDYMVGMYSAGTNYPFVILKTSSFENSYAGMLSWENRLEKDFKILFRLPGYETSQGILDELTPTTAKKFEDKVIVNKDTRVLKGENGEIILLYAIIDRDTIIITVNDQSFKEIVSRLNKEKSLKR